ncbi:membrane protein [Pseudomonas solani]|uniref:Membrane protein n=1 Tax=Pseudomonas solani TaxID=2731552 RepID=A0AAU7XYF8_9PSED|nr:MULTISPECIES: trimeric intracellular cation channel family protein [Pseudomonas]EQM66138.1 membrane protein [Pseudomonas alcaligenes OT 69]MBB4820821.1 putative membrane protein YeiH [Pseudomonas alcaligenes]MDN4148177.1 trimeric intracellular cation channel family protein [Pseudomonas tohonis]MDU9416055.1 trimeric intracellular cation channel family protein [Pseudomonas sp. zfem005]BCD88378.1 membrane protein [Pseudomonas solani]
MAQLFYLADLFGVAVFAITGALMAGRKSMDLFGVLVIAIITALGGGTLRDVILGNHPVSWIRDDTYILVASLAAVGTVLWVRLTRPINETGLLVADAFGLAVFTVYGTEVALQHQVPFSTAIIMGVITGVAGGVMRDVICNEIPLIFQKEIYAIACVAGSLVFIGMLHLGLPRWLDTGVAMLVVLGTRLAAIRWGLSLPRFHLLDRD